jgi:hypothetical protein
LNPEEEAESLGHPRRPYGYIDASRIPRPHPLPYLFQATQLSLKNIREEAALIRERHSQRITRPTDRAASDPDGKTQALNHKLTRHSRCFVDTAHENRNDGHGAGRRHTWLASAKLPSRAWGCRNRRGIAQLVVGQDCPFSL